VRISSFHKDGWFKIKTTQGLYGWIYQTDIILNPNTPEIRSLDIDLLAQPKPKINYETKTYSLRPLLSFNSLSAINVGGFRYHYSLYLGGNLDLVAKLDSYNSILIRLGYKKTPSISLEFLSVSQTSLPIFLGLEPSLSRSLNLEERLVILAGLNFTSITISSTKTGFDPSSISLSSRIPIFSLSYLQKRRISKTNFFIIELGGFYSQSKTVSITSKDSFLVQAGSPDSALVKGSGINLNFGLEFNL